MSTHTFRDEESLQKWAEEEIRIPSDELDIVIEGEAVQDDWLRHIAGLPNIWMLELKECTNLTDAALAHLAGMTDLEELYLTWSEHLTGSGFKHLAGLLKLRVLSFQVCQKVGDFGLVHLLPMPALQSIDLQYTAVSDDGLMQLATMPNLRSLSLFRTPHVTEAGIERLRAARPELKIFRE